MKAFFSSFFTRVSERPHLFYGLIICGLFLTFFHPILAFSPRFLNDDQCYLQWLSRFLFFQYDHCPNPYTFPGTALLWLPGGLIARGLSKMTGTDLLPAITTSIGVTSYLCYAASFFLMGAITQRLSAKREEAPWLTVGFLLAIPVLHYATARSTMAHTGELLLTLLVAYFLLIRKTYVALGFALLLCSTRINDVPVLLILVASFFDRPESKKKLVAALAIAVLVLIPVVHIAFISYYGGGSGLIPVLKEVSFPEFVRVTFRGEFALIYTASFWLMTLVGGSYYVRELTWVSRATLVWMWFLYFICMGWGGMGNSFGYRYLIGTYPFAFLLWFELRKIRSGFSRLGTVLMVMNALWVTHLTWVYDHYSHSFQTIFSASGTELFKQLFQPAMRWVNFSAPSLTYQALFHRQESFAFMGPFIATASRGQILFCGFLTVVVLALLTHCTLKLAARGTQSPTLPKPNPLKTT